MPAAGPPSVDGGQSAALRWHERLSLWAYGLGMRLVRPLLRRKLLRRAQTEAGYAHDMQARFGVHIAAHAPGPLHDVGPVVWVHAVSLGEARAAAILLKPLRAMLPGMRLLLTHTTATGWAEGTRHLLPHDQQTWLPWDDPDAVRGFLNHFRPAVGVLIETEVWPCLVHACVRQATPLVLANARLNERSLQRAQRLSWLSRPAYAGLAAVFAQTPRDAERLRALGARVRGVWGNVKFDAHPDAAQRLLGRQWRQSLARPVVLLASSREGEEIEFLKEISRLTLLNKEKLAIDFDILSVQWLVVPRHPQRFDGVAQLVAASGFRCERRAQWGQRMADACADSTMGTALPTGPVPGGVVADAPCPQAMAVESPVIWLGDSLGEMALYYSMADVALLGGSFEPLGGQNLIEAAACACPVVMGPHTFNFADAACDAKAQGAALRVESMAQGLQAVLAWIAKPQALHAAVEAAEVFSRAHQGAAVATATAVIQVWGEQRPNAVAAQALGPEP